VVRAAIALRLNTLARGHSGIRPDTVARLAALLNAGILPDVPALGSVGASGDLAPLAAIALALMGEGTVEAHGRRVPAALALHEAGLEPARLAAKEGLALINGTQVSTAMGVLALREAEEVARAADIAGAMSLEGLQGSVRAFDARLQAARPHAGQAQVADNLRRLTAESAIGAGHADCSRVQDAYSLRCMPQVHGAVRDALAWVRSVLTVECNASTDNPMVFAESRELVAGGNFHGAPVGYALDLLGIVITDLASISERRTERLINPASSGLPAFLAPEPGLQSGLMMAQVTAAALVSECKGLAHPASVDSIPTSAGKEDHVAMSTWAARKGALIVAHARRVVAIELLTAARALDLHAPLAGGLGVVAARAALASCLPVDHADRPLTRTLDALDTAIAAGVLRAAVERACGALL